MYYLSKPSIWKLIKGFLKNWENYISDTQKIITGGVYGFHNLKNAEKCFDSKRIAWIRERYSTPNWNTIF